MSTLEESVPLIEKKKAKKFQQYFCALIVSIGSFAIGLSLAWTSPALKLLESEFTDVPVYITDSSQSSLIASLVPLGAIFGALPAGVIANKLGRQLTMLMFSVPWIGMWLLMTVAPNVHVLYVARFTIGIFVGLFCTVIPMYINEIAENSIRGILGTFFQLFVNLGILVDYFLALAENYYILNYVCAAFTVLFAMLLIIIPDTPVSLLKTSKKNAKKVLRRFRGRDYDVDAELNRLQKDMQEMENTEFTLSTLFTRANLKALIICNGLMIFQQLSCINGMVFFAEKIFHLAGAQSPAESAIVLGLVAIGSTLLSTLLVDRMGRRFLLLLSGIGMVIGLATLGYYFQLSDKYSSTVNVDSGDHFDIKSIAWLPLYTLIGYVIVFSIGFGPLPWMISSEILSPQIRGFASGVVVAVNWSSVSLVTFTFQPLLETITAAYTFYMYAFLTFLGAVFIYFVVPETKGKSLQEIQNKLEGIEEDATAQV